MVYDIKLINHCISTCTFDKNLKVKILVTTLLQ